MTKALSWKVGKLYSHPRHHIITGVPLGEIKLYSNHQATRNKNSQSRANYNATTSSINYSTLYQLTIFLSPDSDHSAGGSLTNSHCYDGAVVRVIGMKRSNGSLRHVRCRWDLKCVACLKFTDSNSVLPEFSKLLLCWRRVPVKINVSGIESNSTSVRRSAYWICANTREYDPNYNRT